MKQYLGALIKYLLLFLAGLPLGLGTWHEITRFGQASTVGLTVGYPPEASQAHQKLKPHANIDLLRKADLIEPVVTMTTKINVATPELGPSEREFAAALQKHSLLVSETWKLFVEYGRLKSSKTLPDESLFPFEKGHNYFPAWHERYLVVAAEFRISDLRRDRPQDVDEARKLLDQYRLLSGNSPTFHQQLTGDVEGYELRFLKSLDLNEILVSYFSEKADEQVILKTRNQLQERLQAVEAFARRFTEPKDYVDWSRAEAQRCNLLRELVRTDQASRDLSLDRRVEEFAKFVSANGESRVVADVVRQTVRAMCEARLDPKVPFDDMLYLLRHEDETDDSGLVARKDVIIVWDDKTMEWLKETEYTEYTLPTDRVRRLIVRGAGTRPALLKPTPKTVAANVYNSRRTNLPWTLDAVSKLKQESEPHQSELGGTWQRLVEIADLTRKYQVLFPEITNEKQPGASGIVGGKCE